METRGINIQLPKDLHIAMKAAAATSDQTIEQWVTEAIREKCKKQRQS